MKTKFNVLACVLLCFGVLYSLPTLAQLNYEVANSQIYVDNNYVPLGSNDGSPIVTAGFDDENSDDEPIGFTFHYNNDSFTHFVLNTNGYIKLGSTAPSNDLYYPAATSSGTGTGSVFNSTAAIDQNLIAPFNHNLTGDSSFTSYRRHTIGTPGDRICVIQFRNVVENTTTPPIQYDTMTFQVRLYEGSNVIEFTYGDFHASSNVTSFKSAAVGLRGSGTGVADLLTVTKGSVTPWNDAQIQEGNYTGNAFNFNNNELPSQGLTYRFAPVFDNDVSVRQIYTLGRLPIGFGTPHQISAYVLNVGNNNVNTPFKVYLKVEGANEFMDSVSINSLNANDGQTVEFDGFSPDSIGINHITVYSDFDNDDYRLNDTARFQQRVTLNSYSYEDNAFGPSGGVGFTGNTGDFVARFNTTTANAVNQLSVNFFGGGSRVRLGLWSADANGEPDSLLYESNEFTASAGLEVLSINPPIPVNGDFFAGVIQVDPVNNANFAFQYEDPIREGTFFFTSPTGSGNWNDFAVNNNPFRFLVEPRLQVSDDVGIIALSDFAGTCLDSNIDVNVDLQNLGTDTAFLTQNAISIDGFYLDPNNDTTFFATTVIDTGILLPNEIKTISLPGVLNAIDSGDYTFVAWTTYAPDFNFINDTLIPRTVEFRPSAATQASLNFTNVFCEGADPVLLTAGQPSGGFYSGSGIGSDGVTFDPDAAGLGHHLITYTALDTITGCGATASDSLFVKEKPTVVFNDLGDACINDPVLNLSSATPSGGVYSGPGVNSSNSNMNVTSAGIGTHELIYEYTDNDGCSASDTAEITINRIPPVSLSSLGAICVEADTFMLTGGGPGFGFYSGTGVIDSSYFDPNAAGVGNRTVTFTAVDTATGCTNQASRNIEVRAVPSITFSGVPEFCLNADTTVLSGVATPLGGTYSGLGVVNDTMLFPANIGSSGLRPLTYTYNDGIGCEVSRESLIRIRPIPEIESPEIDAVCENATVFDLVGFTPAGGEFSGLGVVNDDQFDPQLVGLGSTSVFYNVTDANGCSNADSVSITIAAIPEASFTVADFFCLNETLAIDNESTIEDNSGLNFEWTFNENSYDNSAIQDLALNEAGFFNLQLMVVSDFNCVDSFNAEVEVKALPDAGFTFEQDGEGPMVQFTPNDENLALYNWDFGDGNTSTETAPEHEYATSDIYPVNLSVEDVFACGADSTLDVSLTISSLAGLPEDFELNLFPNPTQDFLQIRATENVDNVAIFNMNGQMVFEEHYSGFQDKTIDLAKLPAGVYTLRLLVKGQYVSQRIVKL